MTIARFWAVTDTEIKITPPRTGGGGGGSPQKPGGRGNGRGPTKGGWGKGGSGGGGDPVGPLVAPATVYGSKAYVYDATNGKALFNKDENTAQPIASLVKLAVSLVVVNEKGAAISTDTATVDASDTAVTGTTANLQTGDVLTYEELLYGMFLPSGNDASHAAARNIGDEIFARTGTGNSGIQRCIDEMNALATALGATNSTFTGVTGESGETSSMSALDTAIFARQCFDHLLIDPIASSLNHTMTITGANARTYGVTHTDPQALRGDYLTHSKTGSNPQSADCAVNRMLTPSGAEVDIVVLGSGSGGEKRRYADIRTLAEAALYDFPSLGGVAEITSGADPGAHRYWRIRVRHGGNIGNFHGIGELEFRPAPNGPPHSDPFDTVGPMSSHASRAGFDEDEAFDHRKFDSHGWTPEDSPTFPLWLGYDHGVGNSVSVQEVKMVARTDEGAQAPVCFDVEYSDNGTTWTGAWSVRETSRYSNGEERVFTAPYAGAAYSPGAHRYWRVQAVTGGNPNFWSVAEIEFRGAVAGADLTGSGTPVFSDERAGFEAVNAFDDSSTSDWSPNSTLDPEAVWIGYDFGAGNDVEIVEVEMTARSDGGFWDQMIRNFDLEYSDDGVTWERADAFYQVGNYSQGQVRVFTAEYA